MVKTLSIQLSGSYRGPQVSLQSKSKPLYSADLAVKKEFLENKLSLTFRVSDLFNTLKNSYTSWGDNYTADNWRKVESRVAYVSLSYNFGGGSKPKNSKSIENESEGNGGSEF